MTYTKNTRLSLGPVQYYWSQDDLKDFYRQVADSPVDVVYLGENVCSKRRLFRFDDWMQTAQELAEAGKEVVLSTMALLESESEIKTLRRICNNGRFRVEANDMAAVQLLSAAGLAFVTGPTVNIYNSRSLKLLAAKGLYRWVMPLELSRSTLQAIMSDAPVGVETELFAYGRMPLAMSARCYTARAHDLPKDDCQYLCLDYPDGLTLRTREEEAFLAINGIQTQSAQTHNLLPELDDIKSLGVSLVRISPQSRHTMNIIQAFDQVLKGAQMDKSSLDKLMPVGPCDGYWHEMPGMQNKVE
jgi:collagenase-like PrtC family protease